ncbi:hypothetical protein E2C01_093780 [Portunus trituberculatus]|uniref:Uncharacterized protein n=1 Tax=Portunus trituberculatus TaxID=210409 RepID=A0A5B7JNL9_PORTR|nr:hypothetical protein [Portunus trituberculatus]
MYTRPLFLVLSWLLFMRLLLTSLLYQCSSTCSQCIHPSRNF